MKELPTRIEKKGFVYEQIKRNDFKAIYSQSNKMGNLIGHEVFYIGKAKESEAFGVMFPAREVYPCDNDFGVTAWSLGINPDRAMRKYEGLERGRQELTLSE